MPAFMMARQRAPVVRGTMVVASVQIVRARPCGLRGRSGMANAEVIGLGSHGRSTKAAKTDHGHQHQSEQDKYEFRLLHDDD